MLIPTVLAALAALPAVRAQTQDTTSYATRCTTRFGFTPLPTGTAGVPTWFSSSTTTNNFQITYTTRDTVTTTPPATTLVDTITETTTATTTESSTPPATTIPTSAGFLPLLVAQTPNPTPTPSSRIKRLVGRSELFHPLKRQTAPDHTGGFIVNPDGSTSGMSRIYPHRVDCRVSVTINSTTTSIVTGTPETVAAPQQTATSVDTITETTTTTVTEIQPTPSVYAACGENNVVNHITDTNGSTLYFNRVIYRPQEGFPVENELVVNTTSPTNCCTVCQNTPNCAGSFYVPSTSNCHVRLTQPFIPYPSANGTDPQATGTMSILPVTTGAANATCPAGSQTLYLGAIRGSDNFPERFSPYFSNGPCGRMTVDNRPIGNDDEADQPSRKRALIKLAKLI